MNTPVTNVKPLTPPVGHKAADAKAPGAAVKPPKAVKTPKEPKESNFKRIYPNSAVITLNTEGGKNPKRAGSKSHDRFANYKTGMTVESAIKAGVTYADLSWDVGHGFISVKVS